MQIRLCLRSSILLVSALCLAAQTQPVQTDAKELPPRATPTDYHSHAQTDKVTVAAEFAGHGVPAGEFVYSTDEYLVVEVAAFGPSGAHLPLSYKDFSLRINGKKPVSADPYESAFASLRDPEWIPPPTEKQSKGSIGTGDGSSEPQTTPKLPMNLRLIMEQRVRKAAVQEGDRPLPEAGLIFFQHGGKIAAIRSLELLYNGPAGKAALTLVP